MLPPGETVCVCVCGRLLFVFLRIIFFEEEGGHTDCGHRIACFQKLRSNASFHSCIHAVACFRSPPRADAWQLLVHATTKMARLCTQKLKQTRHRCCLKNRVYLSCFTLSPHRLLAVNTWTELSSPLQRPVSAAAVQLSPKFIDRTTPSRQPASSPSPPKRQSPPNRLLLTDCLSFIVWANAPPIPP